MTDLSSRLLDFPVRTAAIEDFRRQLASKGLGDLSAVGAALGDAALFSELVAFWSDRGWVTRSPSSPIYAYPGSSFSPDVSLRDFCGESFGYDAPVPDESNGRSGVE
ncbi:MAG TPA: hypothetical protein VFL12_08305 [Thermoanaerobaculia bacterium]|nr:hypothetical protein [Thermoanaerobaculia bacterium]